MNKFIILFIALTFTTYFDYSKACSCVGGATPLEAMKDAVAVFAGKVQWVKRTPEHVNVVRFCVLDIWKYKIARYYQVRTEEESAACGFDFQPGEYYIVYTYRGSDGKLWAGLCSRTKHIDDADEDYDELPFPIKSYDSC